MAQTNEITGKRLTTGANTASYEEGYDRIFNRETNDNGNSAGQEGPSNKSSKEQLPEKPSTTG